MIRLLDSCLPKRNVTLVDISFALGASGLEYLRARSQIGCDQDGLNCLCNKMQTGFMTAIFHVHIYIYTSVCIHILHISYIKNLNHINTMNDVDTVNNTNTSNNCIENRHDITVINNVNDIDDIV